MLISSPLHLLLKGFILFLHLKSVPLLPQFAYFAVFIFMCLIGLFHFLTLEECFFVDVLYVSKAHSPLVNQNYML